jgi:hypothetical protein
MREYATAPASGPRTGASTGASRHAAVANAAALALCPDGNDVVPGILISAGPTRSIGRLRRARNFAGPLVKVAASAMAASPRPAARRPRPAPNTASAADTPSHSRDMLAESVSAISARSRPGDRAPCTRSIARRSNSRSRAASPLIGRRPRGPARRGWCPTSAQRARRVPAWRRAAAARAARPARTQNAAETPSRAPHHRGPPRSAPPT